VLVIFYIGSEDNFLVDDGG